ncbi:MAG TPA: branched-chain amino acid ABC transporter permease [Xanthobacteraceae bacterium]|nr:branched-chain amino acid ABC transporter permease [Xanthobacteraceae bacterium]
MSIETSATSSGVAAADAKKRPRNVLPFLEVAALLIALFLPLVLQDYLTVTATRILILAIFAISFDLVWGYAGILSFGQALFFGSAGYGVALMARDLDITSIFVVLPASLVIGLVLALALGSFLLLGRHPATVIFVALGTLTGSYAADRLARGWYYLGGQNGISSFPPMTVSDFEFTEGPTFYYLVLALLVLVYLACRFIVRSQFGLALAGLRENEARITFFGYRVSHLKAIVFSLGGAVAGLAGGLYAFHEGFVWPSMLGVIISTQVVLYVLFGGTGTLIGAVVGAVMIEAASFWLSDSYRDIWPIILGVLLLLVIMFRPAGLISIIVSERERVGVFGRPSRRKNHGPS